MENGTKVKVIDDVLTNGDYQKKKGVVIGYANEMNLFSYPTPIMVKFPDKDFPKYFNANELLVLD